MKHSKRSRSDRQAEAEARQAVSAARSIEERFDIIEGRPGLSQRELERLRTRPHTVKKSKGKSGKDFVPTSRGER